MDRKRTLVLVGISVAIGLIFYLFTELTGEDPAPPAARRAEAAETQRPAAPRAARQTAVIRTDEYEATIDNLAGGISRFRLIGDARFTDERGRPTNIITTSRDEYRSLRASFARLGLPENIAWEIDQISPREVRLSYEGEGVRIVRTLEAGDGPYQLWSTVRLSNIGRHERTTRLELSVFHYVKRDEESSGFSFIGSRSPRLSQGTCVFDEEVKRVERDDLAPDDGAPVPHGYGRNNVHIAAVENVYFAQALAASGRTPAARCSLFGSNRGAPTEGTLFESRLVYPWTRVAPGGHHEWRTLGFFGPKESEALHTAGHRLPEVVDLGFFSLIAGPLAKFLTFIHTTLPDPVRNWGIAIILLTLLIRLALFPLTNLSFKSMARMRQLKPDIDRVNELYKDEPEKKGAAIMELYRRHKINPLSGCLPMLLQLPIWWALYQSLSTNIELYHMPFVDFWIVDLSAPDPIFALPLALGALMHLQQRLTPTAMDPMQAKMMMWFMPIMITGFMLFLPSGLCLYMLTNSALGIAQQKLNEWRMAREPGPVPATAGGPPAQGPDEDDSADDDETDTIGSRRKIKRKRPRRTRRG